MNEAHLFFHYSPKRQAFFERVLEECCQDVKLEKLKGLCRTRWVERHEAYENVKELFPAVIMTMDMICHPHMYNNPSMSDWAWDRETKDKANGIASYLKRFEKIASTAKKRVESILDFQLICHLHSGTKCLHTWYKPLTICTRM